MTNVSRDITLYIYYCTYHILLYDRHEYGTDAITPPTAVSRSSSIPNPSPCISTTGDSSNIEDQEEKAVMSNIMCQFRQ